MSDVRDALHERLDSLDVPTGDLARARAEGDRMRRRRHGVAAAATASVGVAVVALVAALGGGASDVGRPETAREPAAVAPLGPLDLDGGLRAYLSPDGSEIHLGGRTFAKTDLEGIDTDAAATSQGLAYYAQGVPFLLDGSGESRPLEPGAEPGGDFSPTAKSDAGGRTVAYGAVLEGRSTVVVRDLESNEAAYREVSADTRIDGLDGGVVVLGDDTGTSLWDTTDDTVSALGGPRTRVADFRGGVVLYDGPAPAGPASADYRLVPGAIDSQLSFDGEHVLGWSGTLAPTRPGGRPIVLDQGPRDQGYAFWTFDTDGSVLLQVPARGSMADVWDCVVPSGRCEALDPVKVTGGDPMFIGNDM